MTTDDKNQTAQSIFDAAAGNNVLPLPSVGTDAVNYRTADAETKKKMDEIIAVVNQALEGGDLTIISALDKEPSEKLGATSEGILREAQSAGSFLNGFTAFKEKIAAFDFDRGKSSAQSVELGRTRFVRSAR